MIKITCCLSAVAAAMFHLLGKIIERDADVLKSVIRVNKIKDLTQLLNAASKVLPIVVTVSGRVGSNMPISCKGSDLRGVIVEETAWQHFMKRDGEGQWKPDSELMFSTRNAVPWYLDDGTDRVHIGARRAVLPVESKMYEVLGDSRRCPMRETDPDQCQCLKMLGVTRIERVLPIGTSLTVIGEAVKDAIGSVHIQRPRKGPFYVSGKTIDQHIADLQGKSSSYKVVSICFTVFGASILAKQAIRIIMEKISHWNRNRALTVAARSTPFLPCAAISWFRWCLGELIRSSTHLIRCDKVFGLHGEAQNRSENVSCVVCLEQEYNSVFIPCGHMCCCMACSSRLTNCPLCRRPIEQVFRTFRR